MKMFLWLLLLLALPAGAAPYAKVDVAVGVTQCSFNVDAGAPIVVAASAGSCSIDVGAVSVAAHVVDAVAIDPLWGPSVKLTGGFTRPALASPSNMRISVTP